MADNDKRPYEGFGYFHEEFGFSYPFIEQLCKIEDFVSAMRSRGNEHITEDILRQISQEVLERTLSEIDSTGGKKEFIEKFGMEEWIKSKRTFQSMRRVLNILNRKDV